MHTSQNSSLSESTVSNKFKKPTKHEIIRRYKQKQKQRQILRNKINVLKKVIRRMIVKLNQFKCLYKKQIKSNQVILTIKKSKFYLYRQIEGLNQKISQEVSIKRQKASQQKEYIKNTLPYIKNIIKRQNSIDYIRVKKTSTMIDNKIRTFRNQLINQRKRTASRIKQQRQLVPIFRKSFLQQQKKKTLKDFQKQTSKIQRKYRKSQVQIQNMKDLEQSLINKFNKSQTVLMAKIKSKKNSRQIRG